MKICSWHHALIMPLQMKFSLLTPQEKGVLTRQLLKIVKMHWFINGTMVEIWKPWKEKVHRTWFNGQKLYKCGEYDFRSLWPTHLHINGLPWVLA